MKRVLRPHGEVPLELPYNDDYPLEFPFEWEDEEEDEVPDMPIGFTEHLSDGEEAHTSDGEPRPNLEEQAQAEAILKDLRTKDPSYLLQEIHIHILADILAKLKTGIASHQELAIARNLLRDNGFTGLPDAGTMQRVGDQQQASEQRQIAKQRTALPNLTDPDYEDD